MEAEPFFPVPPTGDHIQQAAVHQGIDQHACPVDRYVRYRGGSTQLEAGRPQQAEQAEHPSGRPFEGKVAGRQAGAHIQIAGGELIEWVASVAQPVGEVGEGPVRPYGGPDTGDA